MSGILFKPERLVSELAAEKKFWLRRVIIGMPDNESPRSELQGINRKKRIEKRSKFRGMKTPIVGNFTIKAWPLSGGVIEFAPHE